MIPHPNRKPPIMSTAGSIQLFCCTVAEFAISSLDSKFIVLIQFEVDIIFHRYCLLRHAAFSLRLHLYCVKRQNQFKSC